MMDRRAHWIRPNEANRYPRRLVVLDSESRSRFTGKAEHHRLRCAVASFDLIDRVTLAPRRTEWFAGTDAAELWAWVDARTRTNERTVLFAHNLGFDIRLTAALEELPRLGWELTAFSLDSYRCWARWRRGKRSLVMVDLHSFLPASLARIASTLGKRKRPLPAQDAPLEAWLDRCMKDTEITRAAVLRLLRWLETNDMGSFRLTGPAQASAAFRHRFMRRASLLVHDHSPALKAERRSAWTGRCEVWRHGHVPGYVYEWDYRCAYATLARRLRVPVRFYGTRYAIRPEEIYGLGRNKAMLADVIVRTDEPIVPTERGGRILWPIGEFRTTLWDVELSELRAAGARFDVERAYLYHTEPALKEWATWILDALNGDEPEPDPLARIMLKAWSRSLIGRFGLRYPLLAPIATAPAVDVSYLPHLDSDRDELGFTLQVGRDVLEQRGYAEGRDAMPAVMAYVMAAARVRLWRAMQNVGTEHVLYVDTDSLVVDRYGHEVLKILSAEPEHEGLLFKRRHAGVELLAPRVVLTDRGPKVAGIPKAATSKGARRFVGEVWESPRTAIRRGRPSEVVLTRRVFTIRARDQRRTHLRGGLTAPVRLSLDDQGAGGPVSRRAKPGRQKAAQRVRACLCGCERTFPVVKARGQPRLYFEPACRVRAHRARVARRRRAR